MTKYKLPRKLKKAKKHFYLTKEWYELDDKKKFIVSRQFGIAGIHWEMMLKNMSHPYPKTKWIRKYKQHILNMRKKTNLYLKDFNAWYKEVYGGVVKKH